MIAVKKTRYLVNGREDESLDQVPAEFRALIESAVEKAETGGAGLGVVR